MTTLTEKLASVTAKIDITNTRLNTLLTLVAAQNRSVDAILAAIGTLSSDPANYTVKELLALLQTSVDTQPTEKTGENAPPGIGYMCGPWIRQSGWVTAGWVGTIGAGMTHYTPDFSGTIQVGASVYTIEVQPNSDHSRMLYRAINQNGASGSICIGWNTIGHTPPIVVRCLNYEIFSNVQEDWFYPLSQIDNTPTIYPQEGPLAIIDAVSFETRTQTSGVVKIGDTVLECLVGFTSTPTDRDFFISVNPIA